MAITELKKNEKYRIQVNASYEYINGIKKYKRVSEIYYGKKSEAKIYENTLNTTKFSLISSSIIIAKE